MSKQYKRNNKTHEVTLIIKGQNATWYQIDNDLWYGEKVFQKLFKEVK